MLMSVLCHRLLVLINTCVTNQMVRNYFFKLIPNKMDEHTLENYKIEWPRPVVLKLIELWQAHEVLYNTQSPVYFNKHAKAEAIEQIKSELEAVCPGIQSQDIKVKMKNLRTQYTRERSKASNNSHKSGSSTDDLYKPSQFWYSQMSFLNDFVQSRKGRDNLEFDESSADEPLSKKKKKQTQHNLDLADEFLDEAGSALRTIAESIKVKTQNSGFLKYLEEEISFITDTDISLQMRQQIISIIFNAREQQSDLNKRLENIINN